MKSSMLLVATGALLASASPIADVEKRAPAAKTVTEWVYSTKVDYVVATLAPGQEQPAQNAQIKESLRFNDVQDSPEPSPQNIFEQPPSDVDNNDQPGDDGSSEYKKPEPAPAPAPEPEKKPQKKPSYKQPERTYGPTGPKSGSKMGDYATSLLDKHNECRGAHRAAKLEWDHELAQAAQRSAENCIQTHDNHGKGYGQNLAWLWTSDHSESATKVALGGLKSWYDEKKNYADLFGVADPTSGNFNGIGHFTQMVWKDTAKVGCATHRCSNSKVDWVTVCNYQKPGNVPGKFAEMVLPG